MPMASVGQQLRAAREAQGLSVHQVAEITKMKTDHVRAMEDGDHDAFSAPVYIRGFLRSYARLLKLDTQPLLAALDVELSQSVKHQESTAYSGRPRTVLDVVMLQLSQVNWRVALPSIAAAILLVGAILGYRAWRSYRSQETAVTVQPAVYRPGAKRAQPGETLPLPAPSPAKKQP